MQVIDYHEAVFASNISSSAKLDALAISSFFNYKKDEMCWPSNKTLSKITGLSVSTLSRAHKELVNAGLLEVWRRIDNSNMYRPLIPLNIDYSHKNSTSNQIEERVYSHLGTNNELNNETNNEKNNEINNENVSIETFAFKPITKEVKEWITSW
jgi:DNA-binding transcriptional regulator YhcF (GntR family)